jgi:hypothetical protein
MLSSLLPVAMTTGARAASDNDAPQIRWLDTDFKDGTNRFLIALKDDSPITTKEITYTKYDVLFDEYDEITVALVPTTTPNVYYADITVFFPETEIEVRVEDDKGNDDSESRRFDVSPKELSVTVAFEDAVIKPKSNPVIQVKNNHLYAVPLDIAVTFEGLSSASSYQRNVFDNEINSGRTRNIEIPVSIDPSDTQKQVKAKVTVKLLGLTKEFQFSGIVFERERAAQAEDSIKGRYERLNLVSSLTVKPEVARVVFILKQGDALVVPSGIDLSRTVFGSSSTAGTWVSHIYIAKDDTPIELKAYRLADGRTIFIIDVPELGEHKTKMGFTALVRYYK